MKLHKFLLSFLLLLTVSLHSEFLSIQDTEGPTDSAKADDTWILLGSGTLAVAASDLTVALSKAKKWLRVEVRIAGHSESATALLQFNGDRSLNYSFVRSDNEGAVTTSGAGATGIRVAQASTMGPRFFVADVYNVKTIGKPIVLEGVTGSETTLTPTPTINHVRGFWINNTSAITSVTLNSGTAGTTLNAGTSMTIWGSD